MADFTLSAKVTANASEFTDAMKKAGAETESFESKTIVLSKKLSTLGRKFKDIGAKMSIGFTVPLTLAGKRMVKAASDYEENLNKIDVAFGDSADRVKAWSETATASFGLSKNKALEASALYGDMATSMGIARSNAADMSTSLAGLAGDLASFKNIGIDQAMTALNGVFTGETESLKQLGIVMTETNLEEFAAKTGQVYSEMSQAEKVQLRYNYVMEMSKNAIGDYERTSDGTANTLRTFKSTVENLAIALGENLLPLITPIVQKATDMVEAFGEADPTLQRVVLVIGGLLLVAGPLLTVVGNAITLFSNLTGVAGVLKNAISFLMTPMGLVVLAIGAVIAAGVLLITHWEEVKAIAGQVWDWIKSKFEAFSNWLNDVFTKDWSEAFGFLGDILNATLRNIRNVWDGVKQTFSGIIDFITGVFTGNWKKAWNGVKNIFSGVFNAFSGIVKAPLNAVIGLINAAISGLNRISVTIPDWVPIWGGNHYGINLPKIPYLARGTDDFAGGLAYINESGRGELVNLPNGTQVIPHDISARYARETARANSGMMIDLEGILEGVVINVYSQTNVDGTPLYEKAADFTVKKITNQQRNSMRSKGVFA